MKQLLNKGKEFIKNRKRIAIIVAVFIVTLVSLILPSFATLVPVASVEIESEKLSYSNNTPGSWKITKSAKWIEKGKAQITLDVSSVIKPNKEYTDVILALDMSGSMLGIDNNGAVKLSELQKGVSNLINEVIPKGSKMALITFNDTSTIVSDFSSDAISLVDSINGLEATGNTNYYQALINVDNILKNYTYQENRDCVVVFLTDGLPNLDSPNEIGQYKNLKANYPYLTINAIQYEMGDSLFETIKKISDNQVIANANNLEELLYRTALNSVNYDNFVITDYIDERYFTPTKITVSVGEGKLEGNNVTWNLGKIKTGFLEDVPTAVIDLNLRNESFGTWEVYPTNERLEVNSKMRDSIENVISTKTPVLADNYRVIYEGNDPEGCIVTNVPSTKKASVFDTVSITEEEPRCEGYQFNGWELVTEGVNKLSRNSFIMPEDNVVIRAKWAKLSISKSMEGKVSKIQSLYQMMADNSVPDNVASTYVSSSTGINFGKPSSDTNGKGIYQAVRLEGEDTPIYYYRGDVKNNNIIFANYCWKIVRTTATKGIKLIYNGVPNAEGGCNNTGAATSIGTSKFNSEGLKSLASAGYMYGDIYNVSENGRGDIVGLGGKIENKKEKQDLTNYIYSTTASYNSDTGKYELGEDKLNKVWSDTHAVGTGNQFLYTCFSETEATCDSIGFITQSNNRSNIYYVTFTGGELAEDTLNKEIVYGNDVDYDESTGKYTIKAEGLIKSKIGNWATDRTTIGNGHHYTCLNETGTCEIVTYITHIGSVNTRSYGSFDYTTFSNGVKVEEAVKSMTTESEHANNSTIKTMIDNWYKTNMMAYTEKLEDTIWCNDKTIGTYGSWSKDGDAVSDYVFYYKKYNDINKNMPTFTCQNRKDAYTVNDTINGNAELDYPVGLLTADEIQYAGGKDQRWDTYYYLETGRDWWSISPRYLWNNAVSNSFYVGESGILNSGSSNSSKNVRPSVSLAAGAISMDGDGSVEDPFIVK